MSFSFVTDNTKLKYDRPWEEMFPYCNNCGGITANREGICTGCLDGVPWDLNRTTWLTDVITDQWEIDGS